MRKIKTFCSIVLVIASVMVFLLASVPEVAKATAPEYEDLEYLEWLIATGEKLSEDDELILVETKKGIVDCDWEYVRTVAKLQYNHAETALDEIDQFDVSPRYEPIKKERVLSLIDVKWQAHYLKEAAEDFLSGDIDGGMDNLDESLKYMISSISHLEKENALIKALPTPTPTPESPGFGTILAIGSLLAVAYLVLRRRR